MTPSFWDNFEMVDEIYDSQKGIDKPHQDDKNLGCDGTFGHKTMHGCVLRPGCIRPSDGAIVYTGDEIE